MSLKTDNPYDEQFDTDPKKKKQGLLSNVSHLYGDKFRGRGTGYGSSTYDKDINWDADINEADVQGSLNEFRAQNQPWTHKFGAGVGRAALKAGTEITKLPGVIGGIAAAPFQEDGEGFDMAFNNAWIRSIDQFSEESKQEYLPVYVKKAVQEGNLWDNISSIDFWATDGADGIGFIAAMMAPGAIIEGLNVGSKLISGASKLAKTTGMMDKVRKAEGLLSEVGMNLSKITPGRINSVASVTANTIFEAGAEAKSVSDSIIADADAKLQQGLISQEQYDYIVNIQRPIAMRDTFVSNAAILVGPNAIMHKAIWGKGVDKLTRTTDSIKDRIVKSGNRYAQAFGSEGLWEEGMQTTAENYFKDKALKGELGKGDDMDLGNFTKSYIDTISSTEGQKAILLGGVFGGGMTSFQGRKSDVRNRKNTNDILDNIDNSVSNFNNTFDNDIYQKDENGNFIFEKDEDGTDTSKRKVNISKALEVSKSLGYTEQQSELLDLALQMGDTEVINNIKEQAIFNLVLPAIYNGEAGLQALKEKLDSDSQFQEILERDQNAENKAKTIEFKDKVFEQAKYLQGENEKFKNFSKEVISLDNDKATQQDKDDYLNILNANYLNAKNKLFTYNKDLKDVEIKRKQAFDELGIDPLYNSLSETPVSEMKGGLINNDEMYKRAEKTKHALENNSLVKELDSKYNTIKSNIEKIQNDISEIWQGNDTVGKSFNNFVNDRIKLTENVEQLEPKINQTINDINDISNTIELQNYEQSIPEDLKPFIKQRLAERKIEINELEKEEIDTLNEEFEQENENSEVIGDQPKETLTVTISDLENFEQTTDIDLVQDVVTSEVNNTKYKDLHFSNYRIISKEEKTGLPLSYVNKEWIDYENIPSNKIGTELHFSLNEKPGDNKNLNLALQLAKGLLNGQTTVSNIVSSNKNRISSVDELREFLTNYLPLDLGFKDSQTKGKLDTLNGNPAKDEIFNKYIKTARLQIVNHILNGGKLEDITTKIVGQMPGVLQTDINEDGTVPENKITDLNYFQINNLIDDKGELTNTGFHEIRDRLNVVVDFSNLQNANGELKNLPSKTEGFRAKGEFYLKIPKANGEDFYLKLNTIKIPYNKAEAIYEIYKYRFSPEGVINKGLTLNEVSKTNPEIVDLIKSELEAEYNVISKIKNQDDITLKDVIDILIYDNNTSDKVKFNFTGTGIQGQSILEYGNNTIETLEELENKKDELIDWIVSTKRQNIKMGSPKNIGGINTNSKDYLNYLINNNILNTNAITFDKEGNSLPTFAGYTNIYWKDLDIKNKVEIKPVQNVSTSDILNEGDIIVGLDSTGAEVDKITVKAYNGIIKQDGKAFTKVSELIKYLNESPGNFDKASYSLKESSKNIRKSENNSVSLQNNIQFTHQIEGSEENKQVKEMESKIESKQLNLSEDKIMEFIEQEGFSKLVETYSQEKGIKEDNLTTEDYNKIIESNYTKEQIDKICKN